MKKLYSYSRESKDLKMSRAREAREHREFLARDKWDSHRLWVNRLCHPWEHHALPFSHDYDAEVAA